MFLCKTMHGLQARQGLAHQAINMTHQAVFSSWTILSRCACKARLCLVMAAGIGHGSQAHCESANEGRSGSI